MNNSQNGTAQKHDPESKRKSALRVQFVITSLPVGGAEILLSNLLRHFNPAHILAEVCCLKERGALAAEIADCVPVHSNFLSHKWDARVLPRLAQHFRKQRADAVITVGAGDKMFWGRLAARWAEVPIICSALHSTGWPDELNWLNRQLTGITSGFIACAEAHARYLIEQQQLPADQVFVIPNGVDTDRFRPNHSLRPWLRSELGVPANCPMIGIVAALREEKNHGQFVFAAKEVLRHHTDAHFVIVGEGPERLNIETAIRDQGLSTRIHLMGCRSDTQKILAGLDVFCLTSRNEANPVSILEALSCGVPVVSPDVGSISETVLPQKTGLLTEPLCASSTADAITQLLGDPQRARCMGLVGRQLVRTDWSLEAMVGGYEKLIATLFNAHAELAGKPQWCKPDPETLEAPLSDTLPTLDLPDLSAAQAVQIC